MEKLLDIISRIVELDELDIHEDSNNETLEINNRTDSQTIIIQTTEDGYWVRLREPNTAYLCETLEEFETYMEALMTNKIEVCVGYSGNEWEETIITPTHNRDEMNDELDYTISSWTNPKRG